MPNPGLSNSNASGAAPKKDQQKNNKHRYGAISGSMVTMLLLDTVLARKHPHPNTSTHRPQEGPELQTLFFLPLVSREWKNGSNSSYNCTPFLHSLLTKGKFFPWGRLRV